MRDTLAEGRPIRVLRVLDQWSRQSPLLEVGARMSGVTKGQAFDRVWDGVREPRSILVAHESKFLSPALEAWAYRRGVLSNVDQHLLRNPAAAHKTRGTFNELRTRLNN